MMGDDDSNDCNDNLQRLTQDEQRQRIFVAGEPEEVKEFVDKVKSQNWCEEADIDEEDNELAQVNFKYPVRSKAIMKIAAQLSPKVIDDSGNNRNSLSQLKQQQQQQLELLTSNDKSYNLSRLKKYFKRPLNRFEELRMRKSSSSNSRNNSSSISRESSSSVGGNSFSPPPSSSSVVLSSQAYEELKGLIEQSSKQSAETKELIKELFNKMMDNNNSNNDSKNSNNFLLLSSQCQQQLQSQQQQSKMVAEEEERGSDCNKEKEKSHLGDDRTTTGDNNSSKIFERINQMIADEGIFEYPALRKALQREGYQDQGILATFVNKRHYIDDLIEIFKPKNNNNNASQQQQTQNVQQYQQNPQQNHQQHEIQYPSFIQQGQYQQQFIQEQQQEVIEIENDEEKNNNNNNAQELVIQLQGIQNSNEINTPQMNVAAKKIERRSVSPLRRQQDAEQKSIENIRKGQEQRVQKQSYSLSNDPKSKPIKSKSPNNYSPNKSRSITPPQKNPKQ